MVMIPKLGRSGLASVNSHWLRLPGVH